MKFEYGRVLFVRSRAVTHLTLTEQAIRLSYSWVKQALQVAYQALTLGLLASAADWPFRIAISSSVSTRPNRASIKHPARTGHPST
jgi:hypothetical protein